MTDLANNLAASNWAQKKFNWINKQIAKYSDPRDKLTVFNRELDDIGVNTSYTRYKSLLDPEFQSYSPKQLVAYEKKRATYDLKQEEAYLPDDLMNRAIAIVSALNQGPLKLFRSVADRHHTGFTDGSIYAELPNSLTAAANAARAEDRAIERMAREARKSH